jgi:hypothetical protein
MRFSTRSLLAAIASIGLLVSLLFVAGPLAADDQQKPNASPPSNNAVGSKSPDRQASVAADGNSDINSNYQTRLLGKSGTWLTLAEGTVRAVGATTEKRPWGFEQACGPPDTNQPGDYATAWASATPDGQREWLDVMFGEKIDGVALVVYESNAPGAIDRLWLLDEQGHTTEKHDVKDPTPTTAASGVSIFPLVAATHGVRIELDSERVPGWNEIDAVGLIDKKGQIHWAQSAKGSSTYADVIDQFQVNQPPNVHGSSFLVDYVFQSTIAPDQAVQSDPEVTKLRAQIQELQKVATSNPVAGDLKEQELAAKRTRRAQIRLSLLNEELEERFAQLRDQRAAAAAQEHQAKKAAEQTRAAAQQALAAEAQARANAAQRDAERASALDQLEAAKENIHQLQDELTVMRKRENDLRAEKEQADPWRTEKLRGEVLAIDKRDELPVVRLDIESLVNAKDRLGDVASQLGTELKELDLQLERSPDSARGEVVARANKLRDELAGIEATIKQLDKSLEEESTRAAARQDSVRNKAAAAAREDREALERIERLEKAVQELRRAQQIKQDPRATPQ